MTPLASTIGDLTPLIIAVTAAGGLCGGIVALLRVRPESGKLVVEAAEGAVVVQSGVITTLREELGGLRSDLDEELDRRLKCETRLDAIEPELDRCKRELERLRERLAAAGINGEHHGRPAGAPPSSSTPTS